MDTVFSQNTSKQGERQRLRKPDWLKVKLPIGKEYRSVRELVDHNKLHTICESGSCPNMGECWGENTATFMILGNICTRSCAFCGVATGRPLAVDPEEPMRVADAISKMNVKHAVLTSVDRDELPDGGSLIWQQTVRAIRIKAPGVTLETLIPDFRGNKEQLDRIIEVAPEVVSHNMETVERLTRQVRIQAKYRRSLEVLSYLKRSGMRTKTGIMLGLGETKDEVVQSMKDLVAVGCDVLTLGQYLQPTPKHLTLQRFVHPDEFKEYREIGYELGFDYVESGPLVRSSYHSRNHIIKGFGRKVWEAQRRAVIAENQK